MKYQYMTYFMPSAGAMMTGNQIDHALNALGYAGWELCGNLEQPGGCRLIFKKAAPLPLLRLQDV